MNTPNVILSSDPGFVPALRARFSPDVADAVALSAEMCAIPGITVPAGKADMDAVQRTFELTRSAAEGRGLQVIAFEADAQHPYPFLLVTFTDVDLSDPSMTDLLPRMRWWCSASPMSPPSMAFSGTRSAAMSKSWPAEPSLDR